MLDESLHFVMPESDISDVTLLQLLFLPPVQTGKKLLARR